VVGGQWESDTSITSGDSEPALIPTMSCGQAQTTTTQSITASTLMESPRAVGAASHCSLLVDRREQAARRGAGVRRAVVLGVGEREDISHLAAAVPVDHAHPVARGDTYGTAGNCGELDSGGFC
jgi:hypothetical protein